MDKLTAMDTRIFETPEKLADQVAQDIVQYSNETLQKQPRFTIALNGGVTPKLFFQSLTQEPRKSSVAWDKWWFFWGDERCVPKEHSESNFKLAQENLLQSVPAKSSQVFRIHGEDPPPVAARDYEKVLRGIFGAAADWPQFDLILLGMGADGHTASLFPGTAALEEHQRWVVENVVRSLQTVRITLTLPVLNHAKQVWFVVTGSKKKEAFAKAQGAPDPSYPASLVRPLHGELRWYIDQALAE